MKIGDKLKFNDEFKDKIVKHNARDMLFYIKDDLFEIEEIKGDKILIKGISILGFLPLSIFKNPTK